MHQRGFAGTVWPNDADQFAFLDAQRNTAQRGNGAVADFQFVHRQDRRLGCRGFRFLAGRTHARRRRQIVVGAEIGAAHVRVAGDLGRRADRNRSSLLEHLNAIAQFHDQGHVVLDHEDAAAKLAPDFGYRGGKLSRFLFAHAGGGFIE